MFLKQYNYKPRSNSQSSGSEAVTDSPASAATNAASKTQTTQATTAQSRRRSSATEKFAGLQAYKRNSQDQGAADKRLEQQTGSNGVLGNMWHNFTKGS